MTKVFKRFLVVIAVLALILTLTGCGFASKAQKLDEEFKAGEKYSLADIKDKMGEPTYDATFAGTGVVVWIDGCDTKEDVEKLWEEGKGADALVVTVVLNNVTSVDFIEEYKGEE